MNSISVHFLKMVVVIVKEIWYILQPLKWSTFIFIKNTQLFSKHVYSDEYRGSYIVPLNIAIYFLIGHITQP